MKQIIEWSQGNPGAMAFLMSLLEKVNAVEAVIIAEVLNESTIRGTDLYVLWSDLGDKDLKLVANICQKVPIDILTDACSRQDYSGRELIKEYL